MILSLVFAAGLSFSGVQFETAKLHDGEVPEPKVKDPMYYICAVENIAPRHFLKWGYIEPVEKRVEVQEHTLVNPDKQARVKEIITSTPYNYQNPDYPNEMYRTYIKYRFEVDGMKCGFEAVYIPAKYNEWAFKVHGGGLMPIRYLPQKQSDPVYNTCVEGNILPKDFLQWGDVTPTRDASGIQKQVLTNPDSNAKVVHITTSTPFEYQPNDLKLWEQDLYLTRTTYTFSVNGTKCGFEAIYLPKEYCEWDGVPFRDELIKLIYIPQQ